MNIEECKIAINALSGKSGAVITQRLSGIFGEDGMINNLIKMVDELEMDKKLSQQIAKKQGIGIGASVATCLCAGAFSVYLYITHKKQKAEAEKKEMERKKQLQEYREELKGMEQEL